ncbi:MAG: biopolymer transporter Tol [Verrucomicrobiota bacterium]
MRIFRSIGSVLGLFLVAISNAQGQGHEIVGVVDKNVRPISIQSSDGPAKALAEQAFNTHGGFRVASSGRVDFTFRLTPLPGDRCRIQVLSGQPAQIVFEDTAIGTDQANAVLKACDAAVQQTTGKPGYFAGKIAMVSNRSGHSEIYLGDLFFRKVRQLTNDKSNALKPYLSPDGRTLFYRGYYRTGFPDVFKVDVSSGRRTQFASYKGTNSGGAVSPNNQKVALILSSPGDMELYTQDINGNSKPRRLTRSRSVETDPTWSPDGGRLIITSDRIGGPQLFEIPAQGGPMTRLPTNISRYCAEPNWNPRDASKVVFTAAMGGGYELALFEYGKGAAKPLTSVAGNAKEPVWLNDGRHILYTEESNGSKFLAIVDSETGKRTRVSPSKFGNASMPSYAY